MLTGSSSDDHRHYHDGDRDHHRGYTDDNDDDDQGGYYPKPPTVRIVREIRYPHPARDCTRRVTGQDAGEPPWHSRRLQTLRRWSHERAKEILPGSSGTCGSDGLRARGRMRIAMGGDVADRLEDRGERRRRCANGCVKPSVTKVAERVRRAARVAPDATAPRATQRSAWASGESSQSDLLALSRRLGIKRRDEPLHLRACTLGALRLRLFVLRDLLYALEALPALLAAVLVGGHRSSSYSYGRPRPATLHIGVQRSICILPPGGGQDPHGTGLRNSETSKPVQAS